MKERIKKMFPRLYELYIEHLTTAYHNKIKNMSLEEQKTHLAEIYKTCIGRELSFDAPKAFTEKIQWSKLYDLDPKKTQWADKYTAKKLAAERIGSKYIVPLLGVWDDFDDIDFDQLPDSFVLKTNHYSGTNVIIRSKADINKRELRKKFRKWLRMDCAYNSMELHYKDIPPKIIAEAYLDDELNEYKFLCFDGTPVCFWACNYKKRIRNFYGMNLEFLDWQLADGFTSDASLNLIPSNIHEMIAIAKTLSEEFAQVRVDLYDASGHIYFGEMTFTSSSGLLRFIPDEVDYMLGGKWEMEC